MKEISKKEEKITKNKNMSFQEMLNRARISANLSIVSRRNKKTGADQLSTGGRLSPTTMSYCLITTSKKSKNYIRNYIEIQFK